MPLLTWDPMDPPAFIPGERVVFAEPVDRYPHAFIPRGTTGTVRYIDRGLHAMLAVEPDAGGEDLGPWDGCVMWYDDIEGMSFADAERALVPLGTRSLVTVTDLRTGLVESVHPMPRMSP